MEDFKEHNETHSKNYLKPKEDNHIRVGKAYQAVIPPQQINVQHTNITKSVINIENPDCASSLRETKIESVEIKQFKKRKII